MVALLFADSNRARMRYIRELDTQWGIVPASGTVRELRFTGSTLNPQKETAISEEIRSDRMVPDVIETAFRASGDVNIEFSAGSHDDFLEGFFFSAWSRPMTFDFVRGKTVEWGANNTLYLNGKDWSKYFAAGHRVRTDGFVTPANNDYWQINTITWNAAANRTELVMTASTAVVEGGTAYTTLYDANDVIVLKDTHVRAGTGGAATFDSNGNNSFAAAIAAGQIVTGQKVFVEGLGFETGTVTFADHTTAAIAVGASIRVFDGTNAATFQFGGVPVPGNVMVDPGASETASAANLALAINQQRPSGLLAASATVAGAVVTIKNLNQTGGSITETGDTNNAIAIVAFAGGDKSVRGIFTINAAVDDKLTVNPAPATFANAGSLAVTIKGSMLRNPGDPTEIAKHSFALEVSFDDVKKYRIIDGQVISTFAYNIAAGSILTGSFGFMGRSMRKELAPVLEDTVNYSVLNTTATAVANATVNVGSIALNGNPLSTALRSIAVNGNNSLRDQNAVGNKYPMGIGAGRIEITGTVEAYFATDDMWDKFIDHETFSLAWNVTDVDKHHYEFTVPAAVFTTDTENPAGGNQDIIENMQWTAKRDPVTECMFQVDRFSCIKPVTA